MNKTSIILLLTGTLALGTFVGFEVSERMGSQLPPVPSSSITAQTSPPAQAPAPSEKKGVFDSGRARTEAEANTVQVVKERQDGLVYIGVTEGNSPQAALRQRLQDQFGFDFGIPDDGGGGMRMGAGSGFFIDSRGDILTNNHVVEGAKEITVRVHGDRQTYKAKVIGRAPDFDLALIRAEGIPKEAIKPLPLGDSSQLDVGLKTIALGAPFGLDFSVSEGIISSLERTVPVGAKQVPQKVIQTDAAINPGNSGGPLLNSAGQVIGVNTQILTGGSGQSAGVGFAIPVDTVKRLLSPLQSGGDVRTPTLGITYTDISMLPSAVRKELRLPDSGALVQEVYGGSPAAKVGIRGGSQLYTQNGSGLGGSQIHVGGDIITAVDGQPIVDGDALRSAVMEKRIGDSLRLTVLRDGQKRDVSVKLTDFRPPQRG